MAQPGAAAGLETTWCAADPGSLRLQSWNGAGSAQQHTANASCCSASEAHVTRIQFTFRSSVLPDVRPGGIGRRSRCYRSSCYSVAWGLLSPYPGHVAVRRQWRGRYQKPKSDSYRSGQRSHAITPSAPRKSADKTKLGRHYAAAAWRRFTSLVEALPTDQALPLWQAALSAARIAGAEL
jgi:hypothetical protein